MIETGPPGEDTPAEPDQARTIGDDRQRLAVAALALVLGLAAALWHATQPYTVARDVEIVASQPGFETPDSPLRLEASCAAVLGMGVRRPEHTDMYVSDGNMVGWNVTTPATSAAELCDEAAPGRWLAALGPLVLGGVGALAVVLPDRLHRNRQRLVSVASPESESPTPPATATAG